MGKERHEAIPTDEYDALFNTLKEAVTYSNDWQANHLLDFLVEECKRILSLFNDIPPKDIEDLIDADEALWLGRSYPQYGSPFEEAIDAIVAIFLFKGDYARRGSYSDDFLPLASGEIDRIRGLVERMLFLEGGLLLEKAKREIERVHTEINILTPHAEKWESKIEKGFREYNSRMTVLSAKKKAVWQTIANDIWTRCPSLSPRSVAIKVGQKLKQDDYPQEYWGEPDYIRKHIKR